MQKTWTKFSGKNYQIMDLSRGKHINLYQSRPSYVPRCMVLLKTNVYTAYVKHKYVVQMGYLTNIRIGTK